MGCINSTKKNEKRIADGMERLENIPLLSGLSPENLRLLANKLKEQIYLKDEYLMKQNDPGETFYIISSGKCAVEVKKKDNEVSTVATLTTGDFCGEQALLYKCDRTASVRALEKTVTLVLDSTTFKTVLGKQSDIEFAKRDAKRGAVMCHYLNEAPQKQVERQSLIKTAEITKRLLKSVSKNILFETLQLEETTKIVSQMHKQTYKCDDCIVIQGQQGDEFYVVDEGELNVFVSGKKVGTIKKDECFGELALIYNSPRAATVSVASKTCTVWAVQRYVFRKAVTEHYQQRDQERARMLQKMPIFKTFLNNEMLLIADACFECEYQPKTKIISQGDVGDKFYMILSGDACYVKKHTNGKIEKGKIANGYFGELALLRDEKRAADVYAKSTLRTLELYRNDFNTLLGPIGTHMETRAKAYELQKQREKLRKKESIKTEKCPLNLLKQIGVLGKGAFGFVTLVQDPRNSQTYALKAIRKSMIKST